MELEALEQPGGAATQAQDLRSHSGRFACSGVTYELTKADKAMLRKAAREWLEGRNSREVRHGFIEVLLPGGPKVTISRTAAEKLAPL